MEKQRIASIVINILGGVAVLGSYALGIATHPHAGDALWGGVPSWLRPAYQINMLAATVGYLAFTYIVVLRENGKSAPSSGSGLGLFNCIYLLILAPAALWMPLTFAYLAAPSPSGWLAVRGVLFLTGGGALAMIGAVARLPLPSRLRTLALLGTAAFALQTAVLDALVWPVFFRGP